MSKKTKWTSLITKLCNDILKEDDYFKELLDKLEYQHSDQFLNWKAGSLTEKELYDLLKYADILSSSNTWSNINIWYRIITLLESNYRDAPIFKLFSKSILSKIWNYPAIELMKKSWDVELPFEIEARNVFKKEIQKTPDWERIFTRCP